jgi:hypothetical protein
MSEMPSTNPGPPGTYSVVIAKNKYYNVKYNLANTLYRQRRFLLALEN